MATLQQIILSLPIGKANAMKVPSFERAIGNQPTGTNNDQTRREVKEAIIGNHVPIGSSSQRGYWLIDSDAECQEIKDRLNATIRDYKPNATRLSEAGNAEKRQKHRVTLGLSKSKISALKLKRLKGRDQRVRERKIRLTMASIWIGQTAGSR